MQHDRSFYVISFTQLDAATVVGSEATVPLHFFKPLGGLAGTFRFLDKSAGVGDLRRSRRFTAVAEDVLQSASESSECGTTLEEDSAWL